MTIALVATVWIVVRNITSSASQGISLGGITLNLKIQSAQVNADNISVTVQRQAGAGNLTGINFVLYDGKTYEAIKQNSNLDVYQGATFTLVPTQVNVSSVQTVSVAPMYMSSGTEQVGGITDTYNLISGSSGSTGGTGGTGGTGETGICNATSSCDSSCGGIGTGYSNNGGTTCYSDTGCTSLCSGGTSGCTPYVPANCTALGYQCGNPPDGCGGTFSCDAAPLGCNASIAFCNTNTYQCENYTVSNNGTVASVWPSGAVIFFDSPDLPTAINDIAAINDGLHYVRFPTSIDPSACILVKYINTEPSPSTISYVYLNSVANVSAGNSYQIWNAQQGCILHPGYS